MADNLIKLAWRTNFRQGRYGTLAAKFVHWSTILKLSPIWATSTSPSPQVSCLSVFNTGNQLTSSCWLQSCIPPAQVELGQLRAAGSTNQVHSIMSTRTGPTFSRDKFIWVKMGGSSPLSERRTSWSMRTYLLGRWLYITFDISKGRHRLLWSVWGKKQF